MNSAPGLRFVMLEDDDLDAELIREQVALSGLQVAWLRTRGEREFRAALLDGGVELVLSDFHLPGYDGFEALDLAKQLAPTTPFLFVSGAIGEERAIETLRRGATDCILKDRLHGLPSAIQRALALASEIRRRELAEAERDRLLSSERAAREAAETANRLKDEFLATASHELRTPLNAILGWAKLLAGGQANPEMLSRGLATIERNAVAQSRLIEDILDISRIVSGKVTLHPARTPVATFVHAAVDALRPAANAKSIQVFIEIDGAGEIVGDVERLQQVMWNLVSNAVKFTPRGGRVTIHAEHQRELLRVWVEDTGLGIEPAALVRVFERFWQADTATTRHQGGLGLGLSIVRYLVELHGGRVSAKSDGLGKGACFTIELPSVPPELENVEVEADPNSAGQRASAVPAVVSLSGVHVLVVEDDADSREIIALILKTHGARVSAAQSAERALHLIASGAVPDVVVSDIGMPDADGYAFIRSLRAQPAERGGSVPAIALTAFARELDRARAQNAGFQEHIAKPLVPDVLIAAIHRVLGSKRA